MLTEPLLSVPGWKQAVPGKPSSRRVPSQRVPLGSVAPCLRRATTSGGTPVVSYGLQHPTVSASPPLSTHTHQVSPWETLSLQPHLPSCLSSGPEVGAGPLLPRPATSSRTVLPPDCVVLSPVDSASAPRPVTGTAWQAVCAGRQPPFLNITPNLVSNCFGDPLPSILGQKTSRCLSP